MRILLALPLLILLAGCAGTSALDPVGGQVSHEVSTQSIPPRVLLAEAADLSIADLPTVAAQSPPLGGYAVVVTTGGTGLTPDDLTPEATRAVIDREVPGIAEAIRWYGVRQGVPTAALSRGLAGVAGDCLVVNLPGSRGGVKDAMAVLEPVLVHAVEQIVGSDH